MENLYLENSLTYQPLLCNGCKLCVYVCPHEVFGMQDKKAYLKNSSACMECGACQLNCDVKALFVNSGVGCATAMFWQAIKGEELDDCSCG